MRENRWATAGIPEEAAVASVRRRGLLVGASALVGGLVGRLLGADRAQAAHQTNLTPDVLHVAGSATVVNNRNNNGDETNSSITATTVLAANVAPSGAALRVRNVNTAGGQGLSVQGGDGSGSGIDGGAGLLAIGGSNAPGPDTHGGRGAIGSGGSGSGTARGGEGVLGDGGVAAGVGGGAEGLGPGAAGIGVRGRGGFPVDPNGVGGPGLRGEGHFGNGTGAGGLGARAVGGTGGDTNGAGGDGLLGSGGSAGGTTGTPGVGVRGLGGFGGNMQSTGVRGQASSASTTAPVTGVFGVVRSATANGVVPPAGRIGVAGDSDVGHGVFGKTVAPAGTIVNGLLAGGCVGRATGTVALYGYNDGAPNQFAPPYGAIGQADGGFGFWGLSQAPPGVLGQPGGGTPIAVCGVLGTSANNVGIYAISTGSFALVADGNGASTVGALIRGNGGAKAAVFVGNVEIQGSLTVTGSVPKSAGVPHPDGTHRRMYCQEAPEPVFEDFGEARLVNGRATIRLDRDFAAVVHGDDYGVFLTPEGDCQGLYVADKRRGAFDVRELQGGTGSLPFRYRVVAKRYDLDRHQRMERVERHEPTVPVTQGVPTRVAPTGAPAGAH